MCMNNTRQLTLAWIQYAQDSNDRLGRRTHDHAQLRADGFWIALRVIRKAAPWATECELPLASQRGDSGPRRLCHRPDI
ncbi:MAG: hypothetical protein BWX48_02348 [Verrucomicrobia bacterium ADurb.Bin006]|nr:MAG: hypothetical protein BWX48_02348 [Verrucomicrobia bacterium ADurb.Bin006]